jgi:glutaminyl-tRNA synthetase
VRLRFGYFVKCTGVDKDPDGNVTAVRCTYDPATKGGNAPDGRKVKATIHWVSAAHAVRAETRLFEHLFTDPDPASKSGDDFLAILRQDSKRVVTAHVEPSLRDAEPGQSFQFERIGYFFGDPKDSRPAAPVFHRTVTLKDAWQKAKQKGAAKG